VGLWEVTATAQDRIWKGLVGRAEYRLDRANQDVFSVKRSTGLPSASSQDTLSRSYSFF